MYERILEQAGLSSDQAVLYEYLIKNGSQTAGKIAKNTPLKRGLTYKILDQLVEKELAEKDEIPGKVAVFKPAHPLKLKKQAETMEKRAHDAQMALQGVVPSLVSEYNLTLGRPGVRVYEGKQGFVEILKDALQAKTEILVIADPEILEKYTGDVNREYTARRDKRRMKRRLLVPDTEFNRKYYSKPRTDLSEARLMDAKPAMASMQIYDNKTSYVTLKPEAMIAFILEDPLITSMNRALFEYMWTKAKIPAKE